MGKKDKAGALEGDNGSNNIKVCVRCRPFIDREKGEKCAIEMISKGGVRVYEDETNFLTFTFDRAYWSHSQENVQNGYADQNTLMEELGMELLNNAMEGYNDCLFAYGQTGSGKTWSVIGGKDMQTEAGLLPRMVHQIFRLLDEKVSKEPDWSYQCRVSYLEIYNDKLRDLLHPKGHMENAQKGLEVRQHPKFGIYVPGLTESATVSSDEVMKLMDFGMKARSIAATSMNDRSSRSHCIFSFQLTQIKGKPEKPLSMLRSKVNLVDLAGSERQRKTNATGDRLKEGAQINQSLTSLALVIHALAKAAKSKKQGDDFIPFRNSKLTYLLQESLVGNSKTVMIAAISPARSNFEETISTLRFANSVKEIQTKAVVNQDSDQSIINQLKAEIERLKHDGGGAASGAAKLDSETQEQLTMLNELCARYGNNFAEELESASKMEELRTKALSDMGLTGAGMAQALNMNPNTPYLMNIADDPSLSGCLAYFIPINEDVTLGSDPSCTITLKGLGVTKVMCQLINFNHTRVHVKPLPDESGHYGRLCRNGRTIGSMPATLEAKDRFMVGRSFIFKLVVPLAANMRTKVEGEEGIEGGPAFLGDHLAEIMDCQSEDYLQAKSFVENVASRIGEEAAGSFLSAFAQALPLVHEANDITQELRKEDHLKMRLDVVYDVLAYESSEPMLCVRLWKKENAPAKLRRVFRRVLQNTKINKHVHSIAAYLTGQGMDTSDVYTDGTIDDCRVQLLGVWSWRSFLVRLSGMRESYDDFIQTGLIPNWTHDLDPWGEVSYLDVRHRVTVGQAASSSEDYVGIIESLRTRLAIVERELIAERANKSNRPLPTTLDLKNRSNLGSPGRKSNKPQEAKLLATELLSALRNMKEELHTWR